MNDLNDKNNQIVLASPKARKFARELGADLNLIKGSQIVGWRTLLIIMRVTINSPGISV